MKRSRIFAVSALALPLIITACAKNQPASQQAPQKSCINVQGDWLGVENSHGVKVSIVQTGCESITVTTLTEGKNGEKDHLDSFQTSIETPAIVDDRLYRVIPVFGENSIELVKPFADEELQSRSLLIGARIYRLKDLGTLSVTDVMRDPRDGSETVEDTFELTRMVPKADVEPSNEEKVIN